VGVPDDVVGEAITALVRLKDGASIGGGDDAAAALRTFCAERLPKYKVPGAWRVLDAPLQRNAMGKVNKKDLVKALVAEKESGGGKA
jgi:acyl-CoA synthetase (AMP-forming)/AMP-acid ligase II